MNKRCCLLFLFFQFNFSVKLIFIVSLYNCSTTILFTRQVKENIYRFILTGLKRLQNLVILLNSFCLLVRILKDLKFEIFSIRKFDPKFNSLIATLGKISNRKKKRKKKSNPQVISSQSIF